MTLDTLKTELWTFTLNSEPQTLDRLNSQIANNLWSEALLKMWRHLYKKNNEEESRPFCKPPQLPSGEGTLVKVSRTLT